MKQAFATNQQGADERNSDVNNLDGVDRQEKKPSKVTDKATYEKEIKQKKKDWKVFLKFMKKNPETLLGIAEQHPGVGAFVNPVTHSTTMKSQHYQTPNLVGNAEYKTTPCGAPPQSIGYVSAMTINARQQ